MDGKKLMETALELGFADAALIRTDELVFIPAFRALCEENECGKYGVNYACPPDCGTVEEMKQKVLRWRQALVMQTMWDIEDPLDNEQIKPAKTEHNRLTRRLIEKAAEPGLMIGASGCSLCSHHRRSTLPLSRTPVLVYVRLLYLCKGYGGPLRHGLRMRPRYHHLFQYVLL